MHSGREASEAHGAWVLPASRLHLCHSVVTLFLDCYGLSILPSPEFTLELLWGGGVKKW
jgi:hypothetical protein